MGSSAGILAQNRGQVTHQFTYRTWRAEWDWRGFGVAQALRSLTALSSPGQESNSARAILEAEPEPGVLVHMILGRTALEGRMVRRGDRRNWLSKNEANSEVSFSQIPGEAL